MQPVVLGRYLSAERDMPVSVLPRVLSSIEQLSGVSVQPSVVLRRAEDRMAGLAAARDPSASHRQSSDMSVKTTTRQRRTDTGSTARTMASMTLNEDMTERLKALMVERGLPLRRLAAKVGRSHNWLGTILRGKSDLSLADLEAIAPHLGTTALALLEGLVDASRGGHGDERD
ncbi:MAG: helix-turn-helix domain-containing protein [Propionibacteriaceae bacterium]|nr:helix-turn-helix domain-containing protein [Propionibacteriaceae bacterium]